MDIAVLLATFNRKDKTLSCLKSLFEQEMDSDVKLNVFLTDDNSTDGTAIELKEHFPSVNIFKGSGSLFWAGGMRNSWENAIKIKPDFYLLLNDDTLLVKNCITRLLNYFSIRNEDAILIGSTMDNRKNKITYGGHKLYTAGKIQCYNVFSETEYLVCDMANANIMLVPASVVNKIGILSVNFTHSIADFDYTLRAGKAGFKTIVAPGVLGFCVDDNLDNEFKVKRNLKQRIAHLKSPKGLAYKEYMGFISTHFPGHRLEVYTKIWLKTFFPFIWRKFKSNNS